MSVGVCSGSGLTASTILKGQQPEDVVRRFTGVVLDEAAKVGRVVDCRMNCPVWRPESARHAVSETSGECAAICLGGMAR